MATRRRLQKRFSMKRMDTESGLETGWTKEEVSKALDEDPFKSKLYRLASGMAALVQPLNEKDYKAGLKAYSNDKEEFNAKFFVHNAEKHLTGFQLHNHQNPFDAYRLFKDAKLSFIVGLASLYMLVLSAIFALIGWGANCYPDINFGNSIPHGLMILSGLGDMILDSDETTNVCFWTHTAAIIVGVYISVPICGALVVLRLLGNRADIIKSSEVFLLTKRDGKPVVMVRCATANGQYLSNFTSKMVFYIFKREQDTGESYASFNPVDLSHGPSIGFSAMNMSHVCDENSPLTQTGVVTMDEFGVPQINKEKGLIAMSLYLSADGAKPCERLFLDIERSFIQADDKGRIPLFESCILSSFFDWRKSEGKVSCVNDMSKLSSWKYGSVELRNRGH